MALRLEVVPQGRDFLAQSLDLLGQFADLVFKSVVVLVTAEDDHNDGDEDERSASERGSYFLGLGHDSD
jgi:hypothetical protein